jgi:hypothetical protein
MIALMLSFWRSLKRKARPDFERSGRAFLLNMLQQCQQGTNAVVVAVALSEH